MSDKKFPIGIFDSGYGGLTVFREIVKKLPEYDYIYLGDNARAPYGPRSFEVVYQYTLEAVKYLFDQGCRLIILACNTASAKALRTIQQEFIPDYDPSRRVLGVIRPSAEYVGNITKSGVVGVLGTEGTVRSESYIMEIGKIYPSIIVEQKACPMWVSLVENGELKGVAAEYLVRRDLCSLISQNHKIDTIIMGCTHYPLLQNIIERQLPKSIRLLEQGAIVADSLLDYLRRHPEIEVLCSKNGAQFFYTTEQAVEFSRKASIFLDQEVMATHINF